MLTLDVMIVTTAARVASIKELPRVEGVRYIVSIQDPNFTLSPEALKPLERPDVDVRIYFDRGVSRNRNHALEAASADIVMVADDDLIFHPDGMRKLIKEYEQNPEINWLTTRADIGENRIYPPDGWNLADTFRFYVPVTFEMSFRRAALPIGTRFSTLAGIGAPVLGAGEEDLLYYHLRKDGLKGKFKEIKVVTHPGATTDAHSASKIPVVRAKGAVMRIMRGFWGGAIRIPLEAKRSPLPFFKALGTLLQGFAYASIHTREL